MSNTWTLDIKEDGTIDLPQEVVDELGWKAGDKLFWIDNKDGSWSVVKEELANFILDRQNKNEQN